MNPIRNGNRGRSLPLPSQETSKQPEEKGWAPDCDRWHGWQQPEKILDSIGVRAGTAYNFPPVFKNWNLLISQSIVYLFGFYYN